MSFKDSFKKSDSTFSRLFFALVNLGGASVLQMVTGIIRNKMLAVFIGPAGLGLVAQLVTLQTTLGLAGQQGLPQGILRYLPEARLKNSHGVFPLVSTALVALFFGSSLVAILASSMSQVLATSIIGEGARQEFVVIVSIGSICLGLVSLGEAILQSFKNVKHLAIARVGTSIVSVLLLFVLLKSFSLTGAVYNIFFQSFIGVLILSWVVRRYVLTGPLPRATELYDKTIHKKLFTVGFTVVLTLVMTNASFLMIRKIVIDNLGLESNGLFQAAWALTSLCTSAIIGAMTSYTLPKVNENNDSVIRSKTINETIKFNMFLMVAVVIALLSLRDVLFVAFYSDAFLRAADILPFKLAGDVLFLTIWAIGTPLLAMNRLRAFLILQVLNSIIFISCTYVLVPLLGLQGAVLSYFIGQSISTIIYLIDARKSFGFSLDKNNYLLLVLALGLIALFESLHISL